MLARRHPHRFYEAGDDTNERLPLFPSSPAHEPEASTYVAYDENIQQEHRRAEKLSFLRARALVAFDAADPEHEGTLYALWDAAFPGEPFEASCSRWGDIGFQGLSPLSDLRAAGFQGLKHLTQFMIDYRTGLPEECRPDHNFPLALASVTATAMLLRHLTLHQTLVLPGCTAVCALPVLERFLDLQGKLAGIDVLQLLHSPLLRHMGRVWRRVQAEQPGASIMAFPLVVAATYTHLERVLAAAPAPWELCLLMRQLEDESTPPPPPALFDPDLCASITLAFLSMLFARLGCAPPPAAPPAAPPPCSPTGSQRACPAHEGARSHAADDAPQKVRVIRRSPPQPRPPPTSPPTSPPTGLQRACPAHGGARSHDADAPQKVRVIRRSPPRNLLD